MKYINNKLGFYEVEGELSDNYQTGSTLNDYENGSFVLLDDLQTLFLINNPNATPEEVFNRQITSNPYITLGKAKNMRIADIISYDLSESVNCFFINNTPMWLDRNTRSSLYTTVAAYKSSEIEEITLWTTNNNPIPVTLQVAEMEVLLIQLELYAKKCYDVTAQHKAIVAEMIDAEEVSIYDFKTGYPGKLIIQL